MNLREIGRAAADEASNADEVNAEGVQVNDSPTGYSRLENGDGTVTLSFDFNLDPEYAAEMAKTMPKGQTREDQVDVSVAQDESVEGAVEDDARHAETPIENCRAKDPMFCPYHGTQVMTQKLQTMLKEHGIDGKIEVTGKGYHFTAKVTVPAQDEQSAVADIYNGFLQQKGFVAVKKGAKGDDQAESDGVESSYEAEAKVDDAHRQEPRDLMAEWVDNIIDRIATDQEAKKQVSRNDYLDMLGAVAEMDKAADAAAQNAADPNLAAAAKAAYDKASDAVDAIAAMIDYKDVKTVDNCKKLSDGYDKMVAKAKATYAPLDHQVRQKKVALFGARGAYPQGFTQQHPWAAYKLSPKLSDFSATGKNLAEAESQMRAAYGSLQTAGKGGADALSYAERKLLRVALQKMSVAAEQVEGHAAANEKRSKEVIARLDELIAANPNGFAKPAKRRR